MESWEIANKYIHDLENEMQKEQYKYAAMVGVLQSRLSAAFIELSIYHPDAYEAIKNIYKL